jgi:hypothetical protein
MAIQKLLNLIAPSDTAKMLGVNLGTLSVWRCTKRYPLPYVKIGKKVFYRLEDIEKFIESRLRNVPELNNE